jgi:hypothetical protein
MYSKMAYMAMAAGQRAEGRVWLRQRRMMWWLWCAVKVVVVCHEMRATTLGLCTYYSLE